MMSSLITRRQRLLLHRLSYRWVVVLASFLSHVIIYGISWTCGIFFEVFRDEFGADSTITSLMTSLNTALLYGAGPLSGLLTNRFGHRPVAIIGSLVTMVGLTLSAFAATPYHLLVTFGVISGFGLGLSYIPFISIIGPLFDRSRHLALALGLAACGAGIGSLIFPPLLRFLINRYTWKGALLITGGVTLNLSVLGAILRPIKQPKDSPKSSQSDLCRCRVFRSPLYVTLCVNNVFLCFSLSIVYVHLAAYAESIGCGPERSAMLYSVVGGANFCGRVAFGLLANQKRVGSVLFYLLALGLCGLATCLCPLAVNYAGLVTYSFCFGFLSASIGPLTPKVMIDCLGSGPLASAYGYLLVFEALGQLTGAPVAGWLYDTTQFYPVSFYLAGASFFVSVVVMGNWLCIKSKDVKADEEQEKEEEEEVTFPSSETTEINLKY